MFVFDQEKQNAHTNICLSCEYHASCGIWQFRSTEHWLNADKIQQSNIKYIHNAPAGNRTRGPTMATLDFATKPLARFIISRMTFCLKFHPLSVNLSNFGHFVWQEQKNSTTLQKFNSRRNKVLTKIWIIKNNLLAIRSHMASAIRSHMALAFRSHMALAFLFLTTDTTHWVQNSIGHNQ